jgi:hypothetical protein
MAKDKTDLDPDWTPPVTEPEVKTPLIDPEIATLKAQLETERAARAAAETRAHEAAQAAYHAKNEVGDTNLQLVTNAINTVKNDSAALKSQYAAAMEAGDYAGAADVQAEMASNAAKLLQLENGKAAMEAQPKATAPKQVQSDPVEALATQLPPRSAAWVRAHPQVARDTKLYQKMIAAHNIAIADGIEPETDDYYSTVEDILFKKSARTGADDDASDDPMRDAAHRAPAAPPPPAAPVSRGDNRNAVRLSAAQREAAELSGMTEQEYAKSVQALKAEGRLH